MLELTTQVCGMWANPIDTKESHYVKAVHLFKDNVIYDQEEKDNSRTRRHKINSDLAHSWRTT